MCMAQAQKKQFGCLSIVMFSQSQGDEPCEGDRPLRQSGIAQKRKYDCAMNACPACRQLGSERFGVTVKK